MNKDGSLCGWQLFFFIVISLSVKTSASQPSPNLPLIEVTVNQQKLTAELAANSQARMVGLSERKSMPEDWGMLFAYKKEKMVYFWMRDTYIPLSIAFLNSGGTILNILDMEPLNTILRYRSVQPAQFALETNLGWFARNGIRVGDRIYFHIPDSAITD
ncbi:MAG: DUF192 domain-containing protein [Methylococcales bacterium]